MDEQSSDTSVEIVRDEEGFLCLRGSSARLQADGTVLLRCGDESHRGGRIFDKIDAQSCHDIVLALVGDAPTYVVADARNIKRASSEARRFRLRGQVLGLAVVVDSVVGRMLVNAWLKVTEPPCKMRFFTSLTQAETWISHVRSMADLRNEDSSRRP